MGEDRQQASVGEQAGQGRVAIGSYDDAALRPVAPEQLGVEAYAGSTAVWDGWAQPAATILVGVFAEILSQGGRRGRVDWVMGLQSRT